MSKNKYWVAIFYMENMIDNWESEIANCLQVPFAYCIHDKDVESDGSPRKAHVHIIIAFSNTTTEKHAFEVFHTLEKPGCQAIPNGVIKAVFSIRNQYDYLIHNTEDSKKKKKHLYDVTERVTGNNFDIGSYEQISVADKNAMAKELCIAITENGFTNFVDFFDYVIMNYDENYFEIVKTYSGLFERLTKGNFQKEQFKKMSQLDFHYTKTKELVSNDK